MSLSDLWVQNFTAAASQSEREIALLRVKLAQTDAPWDTAISTDHHAPKEFEGVPVAQVAEWIDHR